MRTSHFIAAAAAIVLAFVAIITVILVSGSDESPRSGTGTGSPTATPPPVTPSPIATTPLPTTATTPTPPADPTRAPSPVPTATPGSVAGRLIEHGDRSSTGIALTFDMGGRVDPALDIMNWLIDNEVHATIFMTGAIVENQNTDAGRRVLALVDAHPDLFDLGNHSYSHPDFRDLTPEQMRDELTRTEAAVSGVARASMRPWFRPPFGGQDTEVVRTVAAAHYSGTIMWDIDTIDWRPEADGGPTAAAIVDKVVSRAQGGSIVLMHLGGYNTLAALPALIAGLEAKGLQPVTLDEMLDH